MSVVITLSEGDVKVAEALGTALAKKFPPDSGAYGSNTPAQHAVGKRGELAVELWIRRLPLFYVPFFRDLDTYLKEPDLGARSSAGKKVGLQVKTWRAHNWKPLGRCIIETKVEALLTSGHLVVWCTVQESDDGWGNTQMTPDVRIEGWSTGADVDGGTSVVTGAKQLQNKQVDEAKVRPLDELLVELSA